MWVYRGLKKGKSVMFKCISLGRWLILPLALLCFTPSNVRADLDLTTAGASGFINGGFFTNTDNQSTGTGVINSFVRISGSADTIQGYNTDARPLQFDENSSPQFTRALPLSAVPIVTIGGVAYREFLLDINQTGVSPLETLRELQIFTGTTGSPSGALIDGSGNVTFPAFPTMTRIYDLDGAGDMSIELNYLLNSGSGSGDMFAYIPNALFVSGTYVTLYSLFGPPPSANNDGFEEWAVRIVEGPPLPVIPEPATIITAVSGLPFGLLALRRRFRRNGQAAA
jgi:hypothetical protein